MMRSSPQIKKVSQMKSLQGVPKKNSSHANTSRGSSTKVVTQKISSQKASSPYSKKLKRYTKQIIKSVLLSPSFHSSVKIVTAVVVVSSLAYASYFFIGNTFANEVVVSQSEIIARVSRLTAIPQETPYEIVRVQDEEDLRRQNPFYKDIKEGDYIVMYKDMAVIYDLRANSIVAVKHAGEEGR